MPRHSVLDSDIDVLLPDSPLDRLRTELRQLTASIEHQAAQLEEGAREEVLGTTAARTMLTAGIGVRSTWLEYDKAAATVARDGDLSVAGRTARLQAAAEKRDGQIAAVKSRTVDEAGDLLLGYYPARSVGILDSTLTEAGIVFAAYPHLTPAQLATDALSVLTAYRSASGGQHELGLLSRAYGPLAERRATAPEHFAALWAPFYQELAEAIRMTVDVAMRGAAHRVAVELVDAARTSFAWLETMAAEANRWDDVFEVGAPVFAW